jgi:hypothetical protein
MKSRGCGVTLLELIISLILIAVVLATLTGGYLFIYGRLLANIQQQNVHLQMDYALENIRLHCLSATRVISPFPADRDSSQGNLSFEGESDIHNITPDNSADNARYAYRLDEGKSLIIETYGLRAGSERKEEVLIDAQYSPGITFQYRQNTEPNFLTVTINATAREGNISKTEGLRFWFTDVVKPK